MPASDVPPFAVTWDYLCPFARNVHEHLVSGLEGGAGWEVSFLPFSLMQSHVAEGEPPVWDEPTPTNGLLALEAGVVVRDRYPDRFLTLHRGLFAARHDQGRDLREPEVVHSTLEAAGVPPDEVFAAIAEGWPRAAVRTAHEAAVKDHEVFGVPTFIAGGRAAFVRLMTRPSNDPAPSIATVEQLVRLVVDQPEINELKHTTVHN